MTCPVRLAFFFCQKPPHGFKKVRKDIVRFIAPLPRLLHRRLTRAHEYRPAPHRLAREDVDEAIADKIGPHAIDPVLPGGPLQEPRLRLPARACVFAAMDTVVDVLDPAAGLDDRVHHASADPLELLSGEIPFAHARLVRYDDHLDTRAVKQPERFEGAGKEMEIFPIGDIVMLRPSARVLIDDPIPVDKERS